MKKRLLATLLSLCLMIGLIPTTVLAAEVQEPVTYELGITPLSSHQKGTDEYDVVYYGARPYYVIDKDYAANESENGILMLSQYVYNYGLQWAYSRPQDATNNNSTSVMLDAYALSTFLNGGTYSANISNLATKFGAGWDFIGRDIKYNSYYKRYTATAAVSGVSDYFVKSSEKFTQVDISENDWKANVWFEMQGDQYVLASGDFDSTKTYYRDDASYQLVETPDWESGTTYYYFKVETTAVNKIDNTVKASNKLIGAIYYSVPSITKITAKNNNGRIVVAGKEATATENSFIEQQDFTDIEIGSILNTIKNTNDSYIATTWNTNKDGETTIKFNDIPVNNERFFALSAEEVNEYFGSGKEASASWLYDKSTPAKWWLRSYKPNTTATVGYFNSYNGSTNSSYPNYRNFISTTYPELTSIGVRPAFVLDPNKVLMVSDNSTEESAKEYFYAKSVFDSSVWKPLYDEDTTQWKFTLLDDDHLAIEFDVDNITVNSEDNTIEVKYTGATSTYSGYHFISAFIPEVGYTRLARISGLSNGKSGTATIKLPDGIDADNCEVKIFLERSNGQLKTDYATTPVTITTKEETDQTKSLNILLIGNSLSEDARTFLPAALEQYPYLADAEVNVASLYQGGRSLGYFANCARVEQGNTDYDTSFYTFTNATENSKPNLFTDEQKTKFGIVNNGYNDATKNFLEYWVWDTESEKWVQEKDADNLGEKTIANAMNQHEWDIVLVQGYYCDFFSNNYTKTTGFTSEDGYEHLKSNLEYLTSYIRTLQPGVDIGFYLPTVHLEDQWGDSYDKMYQDMMTRKADIESWDLVDFTISGATATYNANTTYLGSVTSDNTKDKVLSGLRRDSLHASKYVGRELLAMNIAEAAVRYVFGEAGVAGATTIESITSPAVGVLPTEYVDILKAAVDATIKNPGKVTNLTSEDYGFTADDHAVIAYNAAKAAQEDGKTINECIDAAKNALTAQQCTDLKINTVDNTVSFTYGYTTSETLSFVNSAA